MRRLPGWGLSAALLCASPSAAEDFRVLTFNAAGIPLVHGSVARRTRAAGEAIRARGYDVVGLQELWFDAHAEGLHAAAGLPHHARFPRSWKLGTGLSILSRHPLTAASERMFTMRPSVLRFYQGESLARKGALRVRLKMPWGELDVYNTHLVAAYAAQQARYRALRLAQVFELWEMVRDESAGQPFIIIGDLNAGPDDEATTALLGLTGLAAPDPAKRGIDHILTAAAKGARLGPALTGPIPGAATLTYSDHEGVEATIDADGLRAVPRPDPARQGAALALIDGALAAMEDGMRARLAQRSWMPVYGWVLSLRYEHQLRQLAAIRGRLAAAQVPPLPKRQAASKPSTSARQRTR